jgi:riboflavin synthase
MFTGIIEAIGRVESVETAGNNTVFTFSAPFSHELKPDQSVAHNGVCLTVTAVSGITYNVTAIEETLKRTNLGRLRAGDIVNLERCMKADGRFDGHIVQGHVDETAVCTEIRDLSGSWEYIFEYNTSSENVTVEKGSICVNGVSLTVVLSERNRFSVHVIPFTFEHTTFQSLKLNDPVNLEFDIVGKYVRKMMPR